MNHANRMAGLISFHYFNRDKCKYKKKKKKKVQKWHSQNKSAPITVGHWKWLRCQEAWGFSAAMPTLAHRRKALKHCYENNAEHHSYHL